MIVAPGPATVPVGGVMRGRAPAVPARIVDGAASVLLRGGLTEGRRQPGVGGASGPVAGHVVGVTRRAVYVRLATIDARSSSTSRGTTVPARHPVGPDVTPTVIAIELPGGVRVPTAITVGADAGAAVASLRHGEVVHLGVGSSLRDRDPGHDAVLAVRVARWWDPRPPAGRWTATDVRAASLVVDARVADDGRPFGVDVAVERLRNALVAEPSGLASAGRDLVGRGPGMTPAGDDVLAGLLALLRHVAGRVGAPAAVSNGVGDVADRVAAEVLDPRVLARTNDVSADLLRCADAAGVTAPAAAVFAAVGTPDLPVAVAHLATVGHTSGRDLLVGIGMGLDLAAGEPATTSTTPRPEGSWTW